jgi:8-oxo-dGTP pyrophosphatase MutT (NUDIX family)
VSSDSATEFMAHAKSRLSHPQIKTLPGETAPPEGVDPGLARRTAAVTVLFAIQDSEPKILLIRRAAHRGNHRTEWAFPGGVLEPDDPTLKDAALRETYEEVGIPASNIECWGPLPKVITGTGYEVWPFAGRLCENARLTPAPEEVEDYAFIPVERLADASARRHITLMRDDASRHWDAIEYKGRIIWGATARIIHNTIRLLKAD